MRKWIKLLESTFIDEPLYHGTEAEFDAFDLAKNRTAKHIYTSPDLVTASTYGPIVYECRAMGPQADISIETADYRLLSKLAETFADRFYDAIQDTDEMVAAKEEAIERLVAASTDPDYDHSEAEWDVDEEPEFLRVREQHARAFAMELFTEGKVYDYDMKGRLQDDILDEVFSWGYHSICFTDSNSEGAWLSVVIDEPAHVKIISRVR